MKEGRVINFYLTLRYDVAELMCETREEKVVNCQVNKACKQIFINYKKEMR